MVYFIIRLFYFYAGVNIILLRLPVQLPNIYFVADHPFVVSIVSRTKTILFMGRLSKPYKLYNF